MSSTLVFALTLLVQAKSKGVPSDEFGPNFAAGAKAFVYMDTGDVKPVPVPAASSREAFQRTIHLYSVITESRTSVDPLPNPPTAQDAAQAETELAGMEKRGEIMHIAGKTPVQVVSSEVIVTDTLRNQQAQKNSGARPDPISRPKAVATFTMRICRVKIMTAKSKDSEVWVWGGYLVDRLPKGNQTRTSSSTSTRQKELQATIEKRKALAAKKKALGAARTAKERAAAQKAYDQALRDLPAQTAEQNRILEQQALQQEFLMRQQQAQAQSGVQIGVPIAPAGGLYP